MHEQRLKFRTVSALVYFVAFSLFALPSAGLTVIPTSFTRAAQDFQSDMSRIVENIRKFNANSSKSTSAVNMKQMRDISTQNDLILRDMTRAVSTFKSNLNKNKSFLPTKEISESPAFSTLAKMALGYENWLKYQSINNRMLKTCLSRAGENLQSFKKCTLDNYRNSIENERLGRVKLGEAVAEYNRWMDRFGHSQ